MIHTVSRGRVCYLEPELSSIQSRQYLLGSTWSHRASHQQQKHQPQPQQRVSGYYYSVRVDIDVGMGGVGARGEFRVISVDTAAKEATIGIKVSAG